MNLYENIVILNATLTDEEIDAAIAKIKNFITEGGGEIMKVDIWGKKKLAYEIKRHKNGLYVLFLFKTAPSTIKRLEEFYKVFEAVVKHMVIKLSAKQVQNLEGSETLPASAEPKNEA